MSGIRVWFLAARSTIISCSARHIDSYMILDRRDDSSCVQCPSSAPSCNCKSGEDCSLSVQTCSQCPQIICTPSSSGHSSAGSIAGGVVGGLVGLALIIAIYFWWRRRNKRAESIFEHNISSMDEKSEVGRGDGRDTRAYSIDSVNTTQARGSNVIPIAYIPGVTAISEPLSNMRGSVATSDYRASLPDFVMAVHGQPSLVEIGSLSRNGSGSSQKYQQQQMAMSRGPIGLGPMGPQGGGTQSGIGQGQNMSQSGPPVQSASYAGGASSLLPETRFSGNEQFTSLYDDFGLEELTAPFGTDAFETTANSGKSMVTIPEDPEEDTVGTAQRAITGVPRMRTFEPRRSERMSNYSDRDRHSAYPTRQSSMRHQSNERGSARYSRNSSVREYNMNIPEEAYLYYHNLDE